MKYDTIGFSGDGKLWSFPQALVSDIVYISNTDN